MTPAPDAPSCRRCQTTRPLRPDGACPDCLDDLVLDLLDTDDWSDVDPTTGLEALERLAARIPGLEQVAPLGAGGMGVVLAAVRRADRRPVAVKFLSPRLLAEDQMQARFEREVRLLAGLEHPHIVAVLDHGAIDGHPYLVMERIDGQTLRQRLARGPLPPGEAVKRAGQLCQALAYAHAKGVIHRDVKPDNILLDTDEGLKLVDFGLARPTADDATALTLSQEVMGTPHYMAPEQWSSGACVDSRADVYAVGVVLYEMLTGGLPMGRFEPPSRFVRVDRALDKLVLRALNPSPARRQASIQALADELSASQQLGSGRQAARPAVARRPLQVAVVVVVLIAVWFSAQAVQRHQHPPRPEPTHPPLPVDTARHLLAGYSLEGAQFRVQPIQRLAAYQTIVQAPDFDATQTYRQACRDDVVNLAPRPALVRAELAALYELHDQVPLHRDPLVLNLHGEQRLQYLRVRGEIHRALQRLVVTEQGRREAVQTVDQRQSAIRVDRAAPKLTQLPGPEADQRLMSRVWPAYRKGDTAELTRHRRQWGSRPGSEVVAVMESRLLAPPDAIKLLDQILAVRPTYQLARLERGVRHHLAGRLDEAEADLRAVARRPPCQRMAQLNLASVLITREQLDRADQLLVEVRTQRPSDAQAYRLTGLVRVARERPTEAIPHLEQATELDGGDHRLWLTLARLTHQAGQLPRARARYRIAIATAPAGERAPIARELGRLH